MPADWLLEQATWGGAWRREEQREQFRTSLHNMLPPNKNIERDCARCLQTILQVLVPLAATMKNTLERMLAAQKSQHRGELKKCSVAAVEDEARRKFFSKRGRRMNLMSRGGHGGT